MAGRFVYWMNVSLDLMIERESGEDGGGDWMRIGDALHREFNRRARDFAMDVQGRVMYEIMEDFWPTVQTDESLPDYMREYGEIWTSMPKVLVSRTRDSADYDTRVIGGEDAIEQLAALRVETDGDIGVGGATLATQLLRAGLLDELMLFVHPVILGRGRTLFDDHTDRVELDLIEHADYEDGVVLHRYAVRGVR